MTEFTFAPGEKNIIGDRFSPSVIIFWLKTSIAASSTRIQYTTPNTLFGLIPLGADTKTIPLRNVASVDTSTKFNLGSLVWGVVFLLIGLGCLDSSVAVALVCFTSMFVRQVRQCFSAVWADGFPRCRHRFPVM